MDEYRQRPFLVAPHPPQLGPDYFWIGDEVLPWGAPEADIFAAIEKMESSGHVHHMMWRDRALTVLEMHYFCAWKDSPEQQAIRALESLAERLETLFQTEDMSWLKQPEPL